MPLQLTSSSRVMPAKTTYIVGLDGSELSLRAVQIAAQVMHQMSDNLFIVTLGKKPEDRKIFDENKSKAETLAMRNGVPNMRIHCVYLDLSNETSYKFESAFVYLGNHHANGSAILVLGAAGKGFELSRMSRSGRTARPEGQAPMGHLATHCLERCKSPVLLVKSGGPFDLGGSMRVKRTGRGNPKGLNIACCMDSSVVSSIAFDQAIKWLVKSDSFFGYHVQSSSKSDTLIATMHGSCAQLAETTCAHAESVVEPADAQKTVKQQIADFVHEKQIDVLVMGSVQLSDPGKGIGHGSMNYLGSVASAVSKVSQSHILVVKNFATTCS